MYHMTLYGMLALFLLIAAIVNAREEKCAPYWRVWIVIGFGFGVDLSVRFFGFARWSSSNSEMIISSLALFVSLIVLVALAWWYAYGMWRSGRHFLLGREHAWLIPLFIILGVANVVLMNL